mmetsp:Transcript_6811/g.16437  ORF Transcript_6811/g.16437 Transcript_6811/m.16437 type:complete len:303 (-) Transcript_6811:4382-5290(-)
MAPAHSLNPPPAALTRGRDRGGSPGERWSGAGAFAELHHGRCPRASIGDAPLRLQEPFAGVAFVRTTDDSAAGKGRPLARGISRGSGRTAGGFGRAARQRRREPPVQSPAVWGAARKLGGIIMGKRRRACGRCLGPWKPGRHSARLRRCRRSVRRRCREGSTVFAAKSPRAARDWPGSGRCWLRAERSSTAGLGHGEGVGRRRWKGGRVGGFPGAWAGGACVRVLPGRHAASLRLLRGPTRGGKGGRHRRRVDVRQEVRVGLRGEEGLGDRGGHELRSHGTGGMCGEHDRPVGKDHGRRLSP